jgi:hypothetical protein
MRNAFLDLPTFIDISLPFSIVTLFICLTHKDQPFSRGIEDDNAFQSLKISFTTTPLLIHAYPSIIFVSETNAFDFAIGAIFSQVGKDNFLPFVGFHSRK